MEVEPREAVRRDRRRRRTTPASRRSASWRASSAIYLHVGSLAIKVSPDKAANRSFLIDPQRRDRRALRQDPHVRRRSRRTARAIASRATTAPGELAVRADLPWGRLGLTICYDLRFPALYRALAEAGASFLAIPSAFTRQTGEAHWHVLIRARAIENGCFVFAAAQGGKHENGRETFGHSLVVDPWGRILAEGGTEPGVIMAEIDPAEVAAARAACRRCSTAAASRWSSRWRSRPICARSEVRHDPLFAGLRAQARLRNLVQELRRLRQAGEARAGDLPGLRLDQGREGDHGAVARPRRRRRARALRRRRPRRRSAARRRRARRPRARRRSR